MTVSEMVQTKTKTRKRGLGTFIALTFALTWGIAAMFIFTPDLVGEAGLSNPFFVMAVYGPGIAGVVVAWLRLGTVGLRSYLSRLTMFRMPISAWLFVIVGFPVIVYAGALVTGTAGDTPVFSPWYSAVGALAAAMFLAGTVEELGWRGVALPLLQRRFTPLASGLLLGLVWAMWHLPAFALSGTVQSAWAMGPYFAGILALSVIMTWLFNVSKGSIGVAWLVHFQAMNPLFPDAQPWDSLFYVIAAVIIVVVNRKSMLRSSDAVTELQRPGADRPAPAQKSEPVAV